MIERGHIITNKLAKIKDDWVKNLSTILWTDQSIVIRRTGKTSFYLNYGWESVLPIELDIPI